jgi:hypothetical protein
MMTLDARHTHVQFAQHIKFKAQIFMTL